MSHIIDRRKSSRLARASLQLERRRRGGLGSCPTCGMVLVLPGLLHGGARYCCHGCVPMAGSGTASLHPPDAHHSIGAARAIFIARSPETVAAFLGDIELIHLYEPKVARVQVTAVGRDGQTACATVAGRVLGLPYHIEVHFEARAGRLKSTLCSGSPIAGLRGVFAVRPVEGGCVVVHSERYELPGGRLGKWLGRLLEPYIGFTMGRELRALKRLIEDPAALGQALRNAGPHPIMLDRAASVFEPARI